MIEDLLNYFAGEGLTLDLLDEYSQEEWQALTGTDGKQLGNLKLQALKATVKRKMKMNISGSTCVSQSNAALELERKTIRDLVEQNNKLEGEKKALAHKIHSVQEKAKINNMNRKIKVEEILSNTKEITVSNLEDMQKMVKEFQALGSSLDICFCIDGTGSMSRVINSVKQCIVSVSQRIEYSTGMNSRFGLVVYRDYCDGDIRHQVWDFCDSHSLESHLDTVNAQGGGDAPEDCFGGLLAAQTQVTWKSPARVIVWMGDAPQHGSLYNGGLKDSYPDGDPEGLSSNDIFKNLQEKKIILSFCKLTETTNVMIEQMKQEITPYGNGLFLQYSLGGEMAEFLASTLCDTASKTLASEATRGKLKNL